MTDESSYREMVFEFTDGRWWSIEEDPDNPEFEYEVPISSTAALWSKITKLKAHGWENKVMPEGSNRIVLFRRG